MGQKGTRKNQRRVFLWVAVILVLGIIIAVSVILKNGDSDKNADKDAGKSTGTVKSAEGDSVSDDQDVRYGENKSLYDGTKLVTEDTSVQELDEEDIAELKKVQDRVLSEISSSDIADIRENLWKVHCGLESFIVYDDMGTLDDPESERWNMFNDEDPNDNVDDGKWGEYAALELEKIKKKVKDEEVCTLFTQAQQEIKTVKEERSNSHLMKAHEILHDLDYWLFRYPVSDFEIAPPDWSGIYIYFGELDHLIGKKS